MRDAARKARDGGVNLVYGVDYGDEADWSALRIMGCVCDEGWRGPACEIRVCPRGPDPAPDLSVSVAGGEIQAVSTGGSNDFINDPEVQLLILSGTGSPTAAIAEVQKITIGGRSATSPQGTFFLSLDASACASWSFTRQVAGSTAVITINDGDDASLVAASVAQALGDLPSIGSASQLLVTGVLSTDPSAAAWRRYDLSVTFIGADVGGDVSPLVLSDVENTMTPLPPDLLLGVEETLKGADMFGAYHTADINEVQTITFGGHSGSSPHGTFFLSLDASEVGGGCALWDDARRVAGRTADITIDEGDDANVVALRVAEALGALPSIGGASQLLVTGELAIDESADRWLRYDISVMFNGDDVGGDVSPLILSNLDLTMLPPPWQLLRGVTETVKGSEMVGSWAVAYNDLQTAGALVELTSVACADTADGARAKAWSQAPRGEAVATIKMNTTNDVLERVLTALVFGCARDALRSSYDNSASCTTKPPPAGGALSVFKVGTGGPGFALRVTFLSGLSARGNLAQLSLISQGDVRPFYSTTSLTLHGGGTLVTPKLVENFLPVGSTSTLTNGGQIGGSLAFYLPRVDLHAGWVLDDVSITLPWCTTAAAITDAFRAADDARGLGIGVVAVTRERIYAAGHNDDSWVGRYMWKLTFNSVPEDIPILVGLAINAEMTVDGLSPVVGSQAIPSSVSTSSYVAELRAGSASAPSSEVQLLECACSDAFNGCANGPIVLTWKGQKTQGLTPSTSASDLRLALAFLPDISDVRVTFFGGSTTLCSPKPGTTTAITFTHASGPQPPLYVFSSVEPALTVKIAPAAGVHGGIARRGRRVLLECSGRGTCSSAAICSCPSRGGIDKRLLFGLSDGGVGPETPGGAGDGSSLVSFSPSKISSNCGRITTSSVTTANQFTSAYCSCQSNTVGTCDDDSNVCRCKPGFSGSNCGIVGTCPFSPSSFFDIPRRADEFRGSQLAHAGSECGGRGSCVAKACVCRPGWTGPSCSISPCPGGAGIPQATHTLNAFGVPTAWSTPQGINAAVCVTGAPCATLNALSKGWALEGRNAGIPLSTLTSLSSGVTPAPAFVYASPWDAGIIRGCVCAGLPGGAFYRGPYAHNWGIGGGLGCRAALPCPGGSDPLASKGVYAPTAAPGFVRPRRTATQRLTCALGGAANALIGKLTLRFRGEKTRPLASYAHIFDSQVPNAVEYTRGGASLEMELYSLRTLGVFSIKVMRKGGLIDDLDFNDTSWRVVDTFAGFPSSLCASNGSFAVDITFAGMGAAPPPLLRADVDAVGRAAGGWATVEAVQEPDAAAADDWKECNGRGVCDGGTGTCTCAAGFSSSDGTGAPGQTGDCGFEQRAWRPNGETMTKPTAKGVAGKGIFK